MKTNTASSCRLVTGRLNRLEENTAKLDIVRLRRVGRLINTGSRVIEDARKLISAGRCDEAMAALDYVEERLTAAKGVTQSLRRRK